MIGKKNDYSMTFYNGSEQRLFLEFVHNTDKAIAWCQGKGISWTHANIYERRTRKFLKRIYSTPKT